MTITVTVKPVTKTVNKRIVTLVSCPKCRDSLFKKVSTTLNPKGVAMVNNTVIKHGSIECLNCGYMFHFHGG